MKNVLTILFVLLPFAESCSLYSRYERPSVEYADSLYMRIGADLQPDTISIADVSWRALFTDEKLQTLIEKGLENNTDLKIARLKAEEALISARTARLSMLPSASLAVQGSLSSYGGSKTAKTFSVTPTVNWEADIFGRVLNAKRGAAAALERSKAYEQAVQTDLIAAIATSYYTLLMLDEQLQISLRTLDTWEENIRTITAMKRAGKTNEAAVLQAKSNRLNVESSVLTLEKRIVEQENSLSALLGVVPQELERGTLFGQIFPDKLSVGIPVQLLSRRPDVREAEYALAEACYATNTARAAFYPIITLSGSAGWTNSRGSSVASPGSWLLNAVGSLVQPLFDLGKNRARLKIAKAQQEEALLQFRQSLLDAGTEVNNALINWQVARKRLDIDKKQILNLRAAVWNTRLLMQHGSASYLEVLTSQQNLLQVELTETSDRFDEIEGVISLYRALGGGVE